MLIKLGFKTQNSRLLGIHIGETNVTLVELLRNKNALHIASKAQICFNQTHQSDGVKKALITALAIAKPKTKITALAILQQKTISKNINLEQRLAPKKLEQYCEFLATQITGLCAKNLFFDYRILKNDVNSMRLELTIIKLQVIESYLKLCNDVGLKIKSVETDAHALERATQSQPEASSKVTLPIFSHPPNETDRPWVIAFGSALRLLDHE